MIISIICAALLSVTIVAICAAIGYNPDDDEEDEDDERRSD